MLKPIKIRGIFSADFFGYQHKLVTYKQQYVDQWLTTQKVD